MTKEKYLQLKEIKTSLLEIKCRLSDFGLPDDVNDPLYVVNLKIEDVSSYISRATMAHLKDMA